MKRKMIYGDEDLQALQGLQRHARVLREDWDLVFLHEAQDVLDHLAQGPCDVLIVSATLPGMAPEALLREALRLQPAGVRVLLTGANTQEPVMPCVGLVHQVFPRSRDPHQVLALIANALHVSEGMHHSDVRTAITTLEQLPALPRIYQELRDVLEGEHATWRTVGAIIQRDVGMTAKLLKLVNSAMFGLQRHVESPQEAVHFLGLEVVKALVLAHGLFDATGPLRTKRLSLEDVWSHSLRVARGARALAAMEGLHRQQKADAFMGGLLHDAGILVLAQAFPKRYDAVIERCQAESISLALGELEAFGLNHADVGAYLLGLWGIQTGVLEAVSLHHLVGPLPRAHFDHVLAVHLADEFSRTPGQHPLWEHSELNLAALDALGMRECIPGWKKVLESPGW